MTPLARVMLLPVSTCACHHHCLTHIQTSAHVAAAAAAAADQHAEVCAAVTVAGQQLLCCGAQVC